ncbi:hypothetical protein [Alloacidobacterium sp.]|uniref:hypothetical protein n=1 Tax=Alloacidobacterium sp. TaxID=2951999 RepID=UPI002D75A55F|nr:hypothetical protein [Alloacidobacterium sp.]HYK34437.1 hypothetical protein [Alloacidobacterium sp.]
MTNFDELQKEFEDFEKIPINDTTSEQRKNQVRALEERIRSGVERTIASYRKCQSSNMVLARIAAHLMVEHEEIVSTLSSRAKAIEDEWVRVQRTPPGIASSTMPLYYSIRAYKTWLRNEPHLAAAALDDEAMLDQIDKAMGLRAGGEKPMRNIIADLRLKFYETRRIIAGEEARSRRAFLGGIIGALISGLFAVMVALITIWATKPWNKSPQPVTPPCMAAPATPGASSPASPTKK